MQNCPQNHTIQKKGKYKYFSENISRCLLTNLLPGHLFFSHSILLFSQFLGREYIFPFSYLGIFKTIY